MNHDLIEVSLLRFPIPLWLAAEAHQEAIQREFDIIRATTAAEELPNRLRMFIDTISTRYAGIGDEMWGEARAAAGRAEESVDLHVSVPEVIGDVTKDLSAILREADEYCRSGKDLLTLATPADQVAFREWLFGEFERQIQGLSPTPWPDYDGSLIAAGDGAPRARTTVQTGGVLKFDGELDLSTAGELLKQIQDERTKGNRSLSLDLAGVTFIDSVGLSLLVTASNRIAEEGGELNIRVSERLRTLFELTGLVEVLKPDFVS